MFLDPELSVPDDDELCEPQGPVGEPEEALIPEEFDDGLYEGEDGDL